MLKFNFLPKFSLIIVTSFILFIIIGTLTHEFGHIAVAKYFGYDTTLDYGSINYYRNGYLEDENLKEINQFVDKYDYNNYNNWPAEVKSKVEELSLLLEKKYPPIKESHTILITIGGPAQTLMTSCIGLLILFVRRKKWKQAFELIDWLAVFMALFALREIFNFVSASHSSLLYDKLNFYGDEFRISRYLGFNDWIIPIITVIIGFAISCYVVFKIIPLKFRFTFIISGLIGGILGYSIWFGFLGAAFFNSKIGF
ncbi:hypothetical protein [Winogradskyella endarachnes]|uniref:Uncharacterized protein n=1 Tax=Winogradskyella endarachnes TaxID=2681965 RepID=A0A6L6UG50_9FLAO|nr:hypothetical protein [Winogradskyella endarachnes]MUU79794.1 hypothetical protein [Winogradskyella endarachnes]